MTAVEPDRRKSTQPWGPRHRITEFVGDKWSRQPNETANAYQTFVAYLHQPLPRTIAGAAAARGDNRGVYSSDLSSRYRWRERAAAYDEHMEHVRVETERREREAMVARHVEMAVAGQEKMAAALARLTADDAYEMLVRKPGEAWRLLEGAARLERESRGVAPADGGDGQQGTASVQLARAMLANEAARLRMVEAFELAGQSAFDGRRAVIDVESSEPLELSDGS